MAFLWPLNSLFCVLAFQMVFFLWKFNNFSLNWRYIALLRFFGHFCTIGNTVLCLVRFFMNQSFINNLSRFIGGFTHSATLGNFCPHSYAHTCAPSQVPVRTTSKIAWLFNQSLLYLCKEIIIATVIFFFYWALKRLQPFTAIFQVHTRKTKTNIATRGDSM